MPIRLLPTQILNHQIFVCEKAQIDIYRRKISGSYSTSSLSDKHLLIAMTDGEPIEVRKKTKSGETVHGWTYPGLIDFIPAGTYTEIVAEGETEYGYAVILIDPDNLNKPEELAHLDTIINGDDPLIYQAISSALEACQHPSEHTAPFVDSIIEMLMRYITYSYSINNNVFELPTEGLTARQMQVVLTYVDNNLGENLSLNQLSELVGKSPFHFSRQFKRTTGLTPHQFVLDKRISTAKNLLRLTDESIGGIAYDLGFSNQSHFSSVFKKIAGVSPREFRKSLVS